MTNNTEQTTEVGQIKAAIKAIEAQRSILGDAAVDLSLKALQLQLQIAELGMGTSPLPQSEGERRQATILFSDLSGYTAMNEKLDPEVVQELMNQIKAKAICIVERHDGIVNQLVGDEILALFGIPNAHENDPIRAVSAALELHAAVYKMSKEVEPLIGRPLNLHSGINTGLIVTSVWDDREGKFGVTGDTVNTGARLLAHAKRNEILISPETHRLIAPYFRTESLNPVIMKGKAKPMTPYRILGKTKIKTRIEAAEQRGFTTYTGRNKELDTLNSCLEKTCKGKGQFVTVCGEAGLGKSRLIYEFVNNLDRRKVDVLQGRCQSYGVSTPYLPFIDALRRMLNLSENDSPVELHEKVVTNIIKIDIYLEKYIPAILHLLSIQSDQYPLPKNISDEQRKLIIEESLVAINIHNAKRSTTVLILEDWHWVDEASDATLLKYLDIMASSQLMVVVLYRPDYSPKWKLPDFHKSINLTSIIEENVESMIKDIYGVKFLSQELTTQIFQRSEGNPFFIEELCDLLKEEESIMINNGRITLQRPVDQITFPETVQAVVRAKMDRLDDEPKEVIRLASVIGREFLQRILEQITTRKEELSPSLEHLKSSDLIHPIEGLTELTYQFNHVITQEVTYQTLLIKQRTFLHGLVAETIEALYTERLEEQFEILGYHYSKSDKWEKALHYLKLAGDKAARNFSLVDARTYFREAMDLIDTHSKTVNLQHKRIDISLKWAQISHYAAPEDYILVLETSLKYARTLKDKPKIAHLNYWLGQRNYMIGNLKQSIEHFSLSIDIAKQKNLKTLLAQSYSAIGRVYFFEAEYLLAKHCLEQSILIQEEIGAQNDKAYTASFLCLSHSIIGDFEHALIFGEQAIKIAEETGDLSRKAISYVWLSANYLFEGNWKKCKYASDQAIQIATPLGDVTAGILGTCFVGYAEFMMGDHETAIASLEKCVVKMENLKFYIAYPLLYGLLAYCYAQIEKSKESISNAKKCLEWTQKSLSGWESFAYYSLALAEVLKQPESHLVDNEMNKGLHLCQEREQRPFLAQGYFVYARISIKRKEYQKAKNYLNQAIEMFSEMKMSWWMKQTEEMEKNLD